MSSDSFNTVDIDLEALCGNYRQLKALAGPGIGIMGVVKADAYGHGLEQAARALAEAGACIFGVADAGEGIRLRKAGITGEIVLMLGISTEQYETVVEHELTPVIFGVEHLDGLAAVAGRRKLRLRLHLKVDVGMGRLGIMPSELEPVLKRIAATPELQLAGIMSHFPAADDRQSAGTAAQFNRFQEIINRVPGIAAAGAVRHIANSAALLYHRQTRLDMVRPGITLYGCFPDGPAADRTGLSLQPVMRFRTRVVQLKEVGVGFGISYGHTFVTSRPSRLAILPVGYADGYLRRLSNRAEVLVRGHRVPVRGRVCMNACTVDITDLPAGETVRVGDEVVLLGKQGNQEITADQVAGWMETINYEVLCLFGSRNRRNFLNG